MPIDSIADIAKKGHENGFSALQAVTQNTDFKSLYIYFADAHAIAYGSMASATEAIIHSSIFLPIS